MAQDNLRSFASLIEELAAKYSVPYEIVEAIVVDWADALYFSMTGRIPSTGLAGLGFE